MQTQTPRDDGDLLTPIIDAIHGVTPIPRALLRELLWTVIILVALWAIRWIVIRVVDRRVEDVRTRYQWRKTTQYVAVVLGAVLLLNVWLAELGSLATFFGLLGAGIAIALKDPLVNIAAWVFILWRRPFSPGDRLSIRDLSGDVIDQRLFAFTLLEVGTAVGAGQSTGRIIHVPNGWVFGDAVTNHTGAFAYVWHEVPVVVTFESDWRAAKEILLEIATENVGVLSADAERTLRRAAKSYLIFYNKLTPTVYTDVVDHGVRLTLRYLSPPRGVRGGEQSIWEAILDAFEGREELDLAYPTTRLYQIPPPGPAPTPSPG
ncbi:MAG: mechanosensitive ion channel family protein [Bacteroidota bacterium]